jgi:hypothetical protein
MAPVVNAKRQGAWLLPMVALVTENRGAAAFLTRSSDSSLGNSGSALTFGTPCSFCVPAFLRHIAGMSRIIEIRPFRGGWQCWEGDGVGPYWIGETAREQAISYATERAKMGKCEIRALDAEGKGIETLHFDSARRD